MLNPNVRKSRFASPRSAPRQGGRRWPSVAWPMAIALLLVPASCERGSSNEAHVDSGRGAAGAPTVGDGTVEPTPDVAAGTVFLGRTCTISADCGSRLDCVTVDSGTLSGQGPPGGYCTVPCAEDSTLCDDLVPGATCQRLGDGSSAAFVCLLGCELGSGAGDAKCHERRDTACVSLGSSPDAVCMPRCNADTDCCEPGAVCGPARYCDPSTGFCSAARPSGNRIGAPCDGPGDERCRGICRAVFGSDPTRFACTEPCTFGATPSCGFSPEAGAANAYCFLDDDGRTVADRAAGDGGWCAPACDCGVDCGAGLACQRFSATEDALVTARSGTCTGAAAAHRVLDCGGAEGGTSAAEGGSAAVPLGGTSSGAATAAGGTVPVLEGGAAGETALDSGGQPPRGGEGGVSGDATVGASGTAAGAGEAGSAGTAGAPTGTETPGGAGGGGRPGGGWAGRAGSSGGGAEPTASAGAPDAAPSAGRAGYSADPEFDAAGIGAAAR
jgi:hypothetical protein